MSLVLDLPNVVDELSGATPPRARRVPQGMRFKLPWSERAASRVAGFLSELYGPLEKESFGMLMYHRVTDPLPGAPKPTWNVAPSQLEAQLSGLLARGWRPWPLSQVLDHRERGLPLPRKTFVVTFDDGYANNLYEACPILARLDVPATLFVATAYLDSDRPFPNDDWVAAGQPGVPPLSWRPLTTDECRQLAGSGLIDLGAHTHTHDDFRGQPEALRQDLETNIAILREQFGIDQPTFAFPYGTKAEGFASRELSDAARRAGAVCSLTTERQLVRAGDRPFDWGRFPVHESDTARTIAGYLSGWYSALRGLKHSPRVLMSKFRRTRPLTSDL